jgi:hypothetical protein
VVAVEPRRVSIGALAVWGALLLTLFPHAASAAGPDTAAEMYRADRVVAINLTLPGASQKALEEVPESDEYREGTFSIATTDGTPAGTAEFTPPLTVGVRLKGSVGSFRPFDRKAGFKIKLNFVKGQKYLGLKKLTLNNMVQDPSMVHETLTYGLFRALGLPAPRTGYAFLRVNGIPYGVYLNLETYDISLPTWFPSTRHLYEADLAGTDVTAGGAGSFEVDEGDDGDRSDLEALIAAANGVAPDWSTALDGLADLQQMTRMWAVERYVGHWDGYAGPYADEYRPNNYYLHSLDSGLFRMLPWGTDQTWESRLGFGEPSGGLLFNGCFADASCRALYVEGLEAVRMAVPALRLERQASCLAAQLAPWQRLETEPRREYGAGQVADAVAAARGFIDDRPHELAEWLGAEGVEGPPEEICPPPDDPPGLPNVPLPLATPGTDRGALPPDAVRGIRLRRIATDGRLLKARVSLPSPGRLRFEAWIGEAGGIRACRRETTFVPAGPAAVGCMLYGRALQRLRAGKLRLTLRATFTSRSGVQRVVGTAELPSGASHPERMFKKRNIG